MCSVFGLLDFNGKLPPAERLRIFKALGNAAEVRGTDATGVAYVQNGAIQIQKAPRPAHKMRWRIAPDAKYIMGHTRMTTQGSEHHNQNNHPFPGKAGHADRTGIGLLGSCAECYAPTAGWLRGIGQVPI